MTLLKTWNPCELLQSAGVGYNYAILILNRPITVPLAKSKVVNLWQNATVRITVDGGTDRWLYWLQENDIERTKVPDLITGDMDSVREETLNLLKSNKTSNVIVTADQNETDFTKALLELKKYTKLHQKQVDSVIVLSECSGRFDQQIGNINTLFKAANFIPNVGVFIVTNESMSWLLSTGSHQIEVPTNVLKYSKWCSLIPFGAKSYVTTTGLKWNLNNSVMTFGQMVSTSNSFTDSSEITVTTDNPLVWTMGLNCHVIN